MAFYRRVASADDDPHPAIQQQLRAVAAALPAEAPLVGYFADLGPWNGLRGGSHPTGTWSLDDHPIDGGLIELAHSTRRPDRHVDVAACNDADRLSCRLVHRVRIEDDLAGHGAGGSR